MKYDDLQKYFDILDDEMKQNFYTLLKNYAKLHDIKKTCANDKKEKNSGCE